MIMELKMITMKRYKKKLLINGLNCTDLTRKKSKNVKRETEKERGYRVGKGSVQLSGDH